MKLVILIYCPGASDNLWSFWVLRFSKVCLTSRIYHVFIYNRFWRILLFNTWVDIYSILNKPLLYLCLSKLQPRFIIVVGAICIVHENPYLTDTLESKINRRVKINGGNLQISKQLSNHMKGCQNKRNKEKICNVTKTRYQTFWKLINGGGRVRISCGEGGLEKSPSPVHFELESIRKQLSHSISLI